MDIITLSITCI